MKTLENTSLQPSKDLKRILLAFSVLLQPPWRGLSRSLCKSVSSYRHLSILRPTGSSHISWFSTWAQPVWWQPSPQERHSSRTQRQSGILLAFSSPRPPRRQPSGGFCTHRHPCSRHLAIYVLAPALTATFWWLSATIGPGSDNLLGVSIPADALAASLWQLSPSRPLL